MKKLFKAKYLENILQIIAIACMISVVFMGSTVRAGTAGTGPFKVGNDQTVFQQVNSALDVSFNKARLIVYGIAGLAAISLGVGAMFGQFAWKKFFGVIVGIGVIALIDFAISYLINKQDTFGDDAAVQNTTTTTP